MSTIQKCKRPLLNIYIPQAYGLIRGTVDEVDRWMEQTIPNPQSSNCWTSIPGLRSLPQARTIRPQTLASLELGAVAGKPSSSSSQKSQRTLQHSRQSTTASQLEPTAAGSSPEKPRQPSSCPLWRRETIPARTTLHPSHPSTTQSQNPNPARNTHHCPTSRSSGTKTS